jgi:hypothetical protein
LNDALWRLETKITRAKCAIDSPIGSRKKLKSILSHNHNDSDAKTKNRVEKTREAGMETVQRLRAMASLCRQSATLHPDRSWKLLAEAEYWEHLAATALSTHLEDCFTTGPHDLAAA